MTCQCEWHTRWYNPFKEHIKNVPEESKQFFTQMFDELCMVQEDLSVSTAIIEGDWPSADDVIKFRRMR